MSFPSQTSTRMRERRILALWLPNLAAQRVLRQRLGRSWRLRPVAHPPLVISRLEANTRRISALDEQAERLRLKPGMGIADARAINPGIDVVEADPAADLRLLEGIADWCDRYTPLVALEGDDGLFLEITGCAQLFGGEKCLLEDLLARLMHQGLEARGAVASTPGAAWAAARFANHAVISQGDEERLVAPLPLAALRLDGEICDGLESVGLRRVGAVMAAPRAPLVRRFGKVITLRLDQALGRVEEAVSPRLPVPQLSVERHLAEPITETEDVERLVALLSVSLRIDLERRGQGARTLSLLLCRVDGEIMRITVGTSQPLREPRLVQRLFRERLAALEGRIDAGCGFDLVRLSAIMTDALEETQGDLAGDGKSSEELAQFVDRVRARFGSEALLRPVLRESHIPERAVVLRPLEEISMQGARHRAAEQASRPALKERPLRLFARPELVEVAVSEVPAGPPRSFLWRRASYRVARAEGPERIGHEWWLNRIAEVEETEERKRRQAEREAIEAETARMTRDYFRVEDAEGRRFWLYREGLYGSAAAQPRWFLQGLFA
jgi:protein ImuB